MKSRFARGTSPSRTIAGRAKETETTADKLEKTCFLRGEGSLRNHIFSRSLAKIRIRSAGRTGSIDPLTFHLYENVGRYRYLSRRSHLIQPSISSHIVVVVIGLGCPETDWYRKEMWGSRCASRQFPWLLTQFVYPWYHHNRIELSGTNLCRDSGTVFLPRPSWECRSFPWSLLHRMETKLYFYNS